MEDAENLKTKIPTLEPTFFVLDKAKRDVSVSPCSAVLGRRDYRLTLTSSVLVVQGSAESYSLPATLTSFVAARSNPSTA